MQQWGRRAGTKTREVGVNPGGLKDGDRVLALPSPGNGRGQFIHLHWLGIGVPHTTTELGLRAVDIMSAPANNLSTVKCVTGAHHFPSET